MNLCHECGRVNGHHAHCPNAEDIPSGWDECRECGEIWGLSFINNDGVCADCEDRARD